MGCYFVFNYTEDAFHLTFVQRECVFFFFGYFVVFLFLDSSLFFSDWEISCSGFYCFNRLLKTNVVRLSRSYICTFVFNWFRCVWVFLCSTTCHERSFILLSFLAFSIYSVALDFLTMRSYILCVCAKYTYIDLCKMNVYFILRFVFT